MFILQPMISSVYLTLIWGIIFICLGLAKLYQFVHTSASMRSFALLVSGLASTFLGASIILQWPSSAFWVIGLLVSIELIVHGISSAIEGVRLLNRQIATP